MGDKTVGDMRTETGELKETAMQETYFQPIKLDKPVGEGLVRRTGREKVTGGARYSAEWPVEGLLYAVPIVSTIPRGSVTSIDT